MKKYSVKAWDGIMEWNSEYYDFEAENDEEATKIADTWFNDEYLPEVLEDPQSYSDYPEEDDFDSEEEYELYLEYYDEDVRVTEANEIIKGYFRKTYKDTAAIIQKNQTFFSSLQEIEEIYILGHSLSLIDFEYFYEIKQNVSPTCLWNISCLNDEDYINAQRLVKLLEISNCTLFYF